MRNEFFNVPAFQIKAVGILPPVVTGFFLIVAAGNRPTAAKQQQGVVGAERDSEPRKATDGFSCANGAPPV